MALKIENVIINRGHVFTFKEELFIGKSVVGSCNVDSVSRECLLSVSVFADVVEFRYRFCRRLLLKNGFY